MKTALGFLLAIFFTATAFAGFRAYDGSTDLKIFNEIKCDAGLTCSRSNGKLEIDVNFAASLRPLVLASATTITAAQCGSVFYNAGAIEIELPEASTVPGCQLSFVTLNAANFDIDPDAADIILVLANAVGDKIRNATLGNTVTIMAVSASEWVVVGEKGTWTDAN